MSGITDIQTLIGSMEPVIKPDEYVFTTFNDIDWRQIADLHYPKAQLQYLFYRHFRADGLPSQDLTP